MNIEMKILSIHSCQKQSFSQVDHTQKIAPIGRKTQSGWEHTRGIIDGKRKNAKLFISFAFEKILFILCSVSLKYRPMFFTEEYISDAEKMNRIYRMLLAQRRARRFSLFLKLFIIGAIFYGFHYLGLPENADKKDEIATTMKTRVSEAILPMVGSMVQDLTENL